MSDWVYGEGGPCWRRVDDARRFEMCRWWAMICGLGQCCSPTDIVTRDGVGHAKSRRPG